MAIRSYVTLCASILLMLLGASSLSAQYSMPQHLGANYNTGTNSLSIGTLSHSPGWNSNPTAGYYGYYPSITTNLDIGSTYTFTYGSLNTYNDTTLAVWIDLNGDLDFNDLGEQVVLATNVVFGNTSHSITIPSNATPGVTRMRVRSAWLYGSDVMTPDSTLNIGNTLDYDISIFPVYSEPTHTTAAWDTGTNSLSFGSIDHTPGWNSNPLTGYYGYYPMITTDIGAGQSYTFTYGSLNTYNDTTLKVWIDFNGDRDFLDAGEEVIAETYVAIGDSTYTVAIPSTAKVGVTRMRVRSTYISSLAALTPDNNITYGNTLDYDVNILEPYTMPQHGNAQWDTGTNSLSLGTLSHSPGWNSNPSSGYYGYYPNLTTELEIGKTYTFTYGSLNFYNDTTLGVWIDYDGDRNLNGNGERVVTASNVAYGDTTYQITIPATATEGTLRLRVRSTYLYFGETLGPDNNINIGNTLDYDVTVVAPKISLSANVAGAIYSDMPLEGSIDVMGGKQPFAFSIVDVNNASWLRIGATDGKLTGTAPSNLVGQNAEAEVTLVDNDGIMKTITVSIDVIGPQALPYSDKMEGANRDFYVFNKGAHALEGYDAIAGESGEGLMLSSDGLGTWPLAPAANNLGVLDAPNKWNGGASPDPSDFNGKATFFVDAPVVKRLAMNFDYKIINESLSAEKEYFTNFVIEYSEDGAAWSRALSTNANSMGIYRTIDANFDRVLTFLELSGNQVQVGIRISWLVRNAHDDAERTFIAIDNLDVFVPVQILNKTQLPTGQELVPISPIELDVVGEGVPHTLEFDPLNMPNPALNLLLEFDTGLDAWVIRTSAQNGPDEGTIGFHDFGVIASDNMGLKHEVIFSINISPKPDPLMLETSILPSTLSGVMYSGTVSASGGVQKLGPHPYSYILTNSTASWASIDSDTGVLSGMVPSADLGMTHQFTIAVTDLIGTSVEGTVTLAIVDALELSTPTAPDAEVGASYRFQLMVGGGSAPFSWEFLSGSRPAGLSFNPMNGDLVGVPYVGEEGNHTFMIRVSDAGTQSITAEVSINVTPRSVTTFAVTSTISAIPNLVESGTVDTYLRAAGGVPPYQWSLLSNNLPAGMMLSSDGILSGSPEVGTQGRYTLKMRVIDAQSVVSVQNFVFNVAPQYVEPEITTNETLAEGTEGTHYLRLLEVSNGVAPYSWSLLSGSLPAGLSINTVGGSITGIPGAASAGTYMFTLQVKDAYGEVDTLEAILEISPNAQSAGFAILSNSEELAVANLSGSHYSQLLTVQGGVPPYSWTLESGSLPTGVTLATWGGLAGTPSGAIGNYPFVVRVVDSIGNSAEQTLVMTLVESDGNQPEIETPIDPLASLPSGGSGGGGCSIESSNGIWMLALLMGLMAFVAIRRRSEA